MAKLCFFPCCQSLLPEDLFCFFEVSDEKNPGDLLYIKEMILPSYVGMPT